MTRGLLFKLSIGVILLCHSAVLKAETLENLVIPGTDCSASLHEVTGSNTNENWLPVSIPDRRTGAGMVWYSCSLNVPESHGLLYLRLPSVAHADETYVNGEFVGRTGNMSGPALSIGKANRLYPVPQSLLKVGPNNVTLRLRFSGNSVRVDSPPQLESGNIAAAIEQSSRLVYREIILGAVFLFVAVYFFYLWLHFRRNMENFFFSVFSALLAIYLYCRSGVLFLQEPTLAMMRTEYISLFVTGPIFFRFLFHFLKRRILKVLYVYEIFCFGCAGFVLFAPDPDTWRAALALVRYGMLVALIAGLTLLIQSIRTGDKEALYLFGAFLIFFGAVAHDLLFALDLFKSTFIVPYGFLVFLLGIAVILANRYVRYYGEQQAQGEALKDSDKRKTEFLSNISHELKTPLAEIMLYAESLSDGTLETDEEIADAHLEITKSAARLEHIVSDTVLLNLLETHQYTPTIVTSRLIDRISTAISSVTAIASKKGVLLRMDLSDDLQVECDTALFDRALEHLLENGVIYNKTGGILKISAVAGGRSVQLFIEDQGEGLPDGVRSRLFQKFVRGDASSTYAVAGTGTGLALVKASLESMSALVELQSTGKDGTRFVVTLRQSAIPDGALETELFPEGSHA